MTSARPVMRLFTRISISKILFVILAFFLLSGCQYLTTSRLQPEAPDTLSSEEEQAGDLPQMLAVSDTLMRASAEYDPELPEVTDPLPPPPRDLWDRIRQGISPEILALDNPRIKVQRDWYARHQAYLDRVAGRASLYLYHIVEQAEEREIPLEIALLPIVESAFDPFAYSHGRAAGIWQFIPGTGKIFGMKQNYWYDGRRDILASTKGAMDYLESLHQRLDGNWFHALAAYNSGSGTVKRAIRYNLARGRDTDFWSLKLPRETSAYVPKLIAIAQIIAEPEKYGITLKPIPNEPVFEVVETGGQIDLAHAAELAGISTEEIYRFNPGFNRWATDPDGPHHLLIPLDHAQQFRENLAALPPEERIQWTLYKIRPGDTLGSIAQKHHTTISQLKRTNGIRGNMIRAGHTLLIPKARGTRHDYALSEEQRLLARQSRPIPGRQKITYTVKKGDTFWELARHFGVNHRSLARWNGMAPTDPLTVGKKLVIWVSSSSTAAQQEMATPAIPGVLRTINYTVKSGDSLSRIASRFNLAVADIEKWNRINASSYLQPGQRLKLLVDVRNAY